MDRAKNGMPSGVIAVLISIAFFLVSWLWLLPQYKQNEADFAKVDYEVTAAKDKLDSLKSAQSTLNDLGGTLDSMFVAIPKDQDSGNVITTLEAIAVANKTYIPSFQITDSGASALGGSVKPVTSGTVSVVFSTSGTFEGLNAFVKSIESNLKIFNIKSLTVSSGDKGMNMTVQLDAYVQKNISSLSS